MQAGAGFTFKPAPKVQQVAWKPNRKAKDTVSLIQESPFYKKLEPETLLRSQTSLEAEEYSSSRFEMNSLIGSIVSAYNQHHALVLRPDDVWLAVVSQFSAFMSKNAEAVRDKVVDFEGKQTIKVSDGDVSAAGLPVYLNAEGGSSNVAWESFVQVCGDKIAERVKDPEVVTWAEPGFSTTTAIDRTVGRSMLMASLQAFFTYKFSLRCGLPSVTLLGTEEDWASIRKRADWLLTLENEQLNSWHAMLTPVLDKFVDSAKGKPDLEWWQQCCHYEGGGSGPTYLCGWVTVFSVWNDEFEWKGDCKKASSWGKAITSEWPVLDTQEVAPAITSVPVKVDNNGDQYTARLIAGVWAVVSPEDNTIQPSPSWAFIRVKEPYDA